MKIDRRTCFTGLAIGALTTAVTGRALADVDAATPLPPSFPRQDPDLVRAVVGASHGNLEKVRELVEPRPELARASWDWGFGDWESALGAASHTGQIEIVEYLLAHGARPNLFTHAVLGELEVVRAICTSRPGIQALPGPHGLSLLHHARAGGEGSQRVVDYLEALGDADPQAKNLPLDEGIQARLLGLYRGPEGPEVRIETHRSGLLGLTPGDGPLRVLFHQGDLVFHPTGCPSVRVSFDPGEGRLEIASPEGPWRAHRSKSS